MLYSVYLVVIVYQQCRLELVQISEVIDHAEASGRIAFSCPSKQVSENVQWIFEFHEHTYLCKVQ